MGKQGPKAPEPSGRQVLLALPIIIAVLIGLLVGIDALVEWGFEADKAPETATPVETIEAPIDVQMLYDTSSWTFERSGDGVSVQTDLYMDDEGRGYADNICKLTLGSVDGIDHVVVTGQNGRHGCKRWDR